MNLQKLLTFGLLFISVNLLAQPTFRSSDTTRGTKLEMDSVLAFTAVCSDYYLTIDEEGNTIGYPILDSTLGDAVHFSTTLDFSNEVRDILGGKNDLWVVYENGTTAQYKILAGDIVFQKTLTGSQIANAGTPAKYLIAFDQGIGVINTKGEIWLHLIKKKVENAVQVKSPKIAVEGVPATNVFRYRQYVVVLNESGDLWAHEIVVIPDAVFISFARQMKGPKLRNIQHVTTSDNLMFTVDDQGFLKMYMCAL
ncbi:MAG: hypothetical protein GC181_10400 [Bacteroidetes bacterium]|nr:hypothetical protein [Bacteroidota bacterium]